MSLALSAPCAVWWIALIVIHLGAAILALQQPRRHVRAGAQTARPPVSILIPVQRIEHDMETALSSAFAQRYPRFEIVVSAARDDAPGLAAAERVRSRFPNVASRVDVSETPVAASPKVNNLARPLAEAAHDHVFILDSNIRLAPDQLQEFGDALTSGIGLAVAVQIAAEPQSFAAEIECAFINGYQGRLFLAASALGGGFGIGKAMLFRRSDFMRAGGIPAIATSVLEDHAISKALRRIGLETAIIGSVVVQALGPRRFADVWNRQFRWMVCRRHEEPFAFALEPFCGALAAVAAATGAAPLAGVSPWAAALGTLALWFGTEGLFLVAKGWGIRAASPAAWLLREIVMPAMWLRALTTSRVRWGETSLDVRRGGVAPLQSSAGLTDRTRA